MKDAMEYMSLEKFGKIVARVMATLPAEFDQYLDNLFVEVEEEPDEKTLRDLEYTQEEIEEGESLYGLFVPMQLPSMWGGESVNLRDLPHRIIIYKRPLEEDFPDRRELLLEIRKTVIHELAHHFGYSERDLDRFESKADPFGDDLDLEESKEDPAP
jgi:predicted Zn-dependent protease with MMP-like domain